MKSMQGNLNIKTNVVKKNYTFCIRHPDGTEDMKKVEAESREAATLLVCSLYAEQNCKIFLKEGEEHS